jgi:hypothetical protein
VVPEWLFQDEGYSGATLARPGLERLRDLAAEGQIETILVYAPDRLSRKYAYQVLLMEEFARQGVKTVCSPGGHPGGRAPRPVPGYDRRIGTSPDRGAYPARQTAPRQRWFGKRALRRTLRVPLCAEL